MEKRGIWMNAPRECNQEIFNCSDITPLDFDRINTQRKQQLGDLNKYDSGKSLVRLTENNIEKI